MSSRDEQGGRQDSGGPGPGLQRFPAQPPPCKCGHFPLYFFSQDDGTSTYTNRGMHPRTDIHSMGATSFANELEECRSYRSTAKRSPVQQTFGRESATIFVSQALAIAWLGSRFPSLLTWIFEHCKASSGAFTWDSRSLDFSDRLLRPVFLAHLMIQSRNAPHSW